MTVTTVLIGLVYAGVGVGLLIVTVALIKMDGAGCCGVVGLLLGHRFRARWGKTYCREPDRSQRAATWMQWEICERCGAIRMDRELEGDEDDGEDEAPMPVPVDDDLRVQY